MRKCRYHIGIDAGGSRPSCLFGNQIDCLTGLSSKLVCLPPHLVVGKLPDGDVGNPGGVRHDVPPVALGRTAARRRTAATDPKSDGSQRTLVLMRSGQLA